MNRFTPGPWHIVPKQAELTGDGVVCELDLLSIRPADGVKLESEVHDANLIVAAPEMLEALERAALAMWHSEANMDTEAAFLEEVIAKARGIK